MTIETISVELPINMLKAAILFAAQNDGRMRLCGVCVDIGPQGTRIVTTDGHRLFAGLASAEVTHGIGRRYVIATDIVKAALKLAHKAHSSLPSIWEQESTPDPERDGVTVVQQARITIGGVVTADLQDTGGSFPDWTRIVPKRESHKAAQFNPAYLYDCGRAYALLSGRSPTDPANMQSLIIHHNGNNAAYVSLAANAFAVVMPIRWDKKDFEYTVPEWLTGATPAANAAKAAA